jgi:hypothetical protein
LSKSEKEDLHLVIGDLSLLLAQSKKQRIIPTQAIALDILMPIKEKKR